MNNNIGDNKGDNISKNFTLSEMIYSDTARRKGIDNTPDAKTVQNIKDLVINILQPIREKWGKPITINSGYRSSVLNKAVGGVSTSQHLSGGAADITSSDNKALWNLIVSMINSGEITVGQLLDEKRLTWIHISIPTQKHHNQILRL